MRRNSDLALTRADAKWNTQNHIAKWATPMLVVHGRRDYRISESDAIGGACDGLAVRLTQAVFNTLQSLGVPSRLVIFEVRAGGAAISLTARRTKGTRAGR